MRGEVLLIAGFAGGSDLMARVAGGPDLAARVTAGLESTVLAAMVDGNGCSVYLIRLRGKAVVGADISKS